MRTHFIVGLVVFALVLGAGSVFARSIAVAPPPEETLHEAGLATDSASLIQYLENGIPADHVAPTSEDRQEPPFVMRRFDLYGSMVSVLSKENTPAVLSLFRKLQTGEFSPIMEADLAVYVAAQQRVGRENTWEDWDEATLLRRDRFRMACALGVAKLTDESPVPFLEELLRTWTPVYLENYAQEFDNHHLDQFYYAICRTLTVHGAKTGVDALMALFDQPRVDRSPPVSILQQWTRQNFGPRYDDSAQTKAAEIEKWKTWWAANRDSFVADATNIENRTPRRMPNPAPTSLRDRVWHVTEGRMDYDGLWSSKMATAWLEENGARETRNLKKIVEDENERLTIRAEALKWYVKFDRNPSYEMLLGYAKQPLLPYYKERFPERWVELNKMLLEAYPGDSSGSVHVLSETPEGQAFLVKYFASLRDDPQFQVIQFFARQPNPPMSVLEEGLQEDYLLVAAFAALGVDLSDSEPRLGAQARAALSEWRKNPEFLMRVIEFGGEQDATVQDFDAVFHAIDTHDPHTAEIYVRTERTLESFARYSENLKADPAGVARLRTGALGGFLKCVEAYRTSRGQTTPLPAYAI